MTPCTANLIRTARWHLGPGIRRDERSWGRTSRRPNIRQGSKPDVELHARFGHARILGSQEPLIPANAGTQITGLGRRLAFYVYIVASRRNGTIYTGSTDDLGKRIWEHKTKAREGFSKTYGCDRLVWFETFSSREEAFRRERRIKEWRRSWKLMLIEEDNPTWRDLYDTLHGEPDPAGVSASGSRHSPG